MSNLNLNTVFIIIAYLVETKHSIGFLWDDLVEQFGEPIRAAKHFRKAAHKAHKRINARKLNNEDLAAMAAKFLIELGLYGNNGDELAYNGKFYVYQDGCWEYDSDVNPAVRPEAIGEGIIRF